MGLSARGSPDERFPNPGLHRPEVGRNSRPRTANRLFLSIGLIGFIAEPKVDYTLVEKPAKSKIIAEPPAAESIPRKSGTANVNPSTVEKINLEALSYSLLGVVFIALGLALNTALRRVIKNKGVDEVESRVTIEAISEKEIQAIAAIVDDKDGATLLSLTFRDI